jgi:hypothetical protein
MEQDNLSKMLLHETVSEVRLGQPLSDTFSELYLLFYSKMTSTEHKNELKVHGNISCLSRPMMFI